MFGISRRAGKQLPELPEPPPGFRLVRRLGEGKNGAVFLARKEHRLCRSQADRRLLSGLSTIGFEGEELEQEVREFSELFSRWWERGLVARVLEALRFGRWPKRTVALKHLTRRAWVELHAVSVFRMPLTFTPVYSILPQNVRIFGIHEYGDTYWVEMEYVRGTSLKDILPSLGGSARPPRWLKGAAGFLRLADNLCLAVECLHIRNILHRDLHAGNVLLLRRQPWVKVTDYGLAQPSRFATRYPRGGFEDYDPRWAIRTFGDGTAGLAEVTAPTESWPHVGEVNRPFIAPEVHRRDYSPHSDLFSVAAILQVVLDYLALDQATDPGLRFARVLAQGLAPNPLDRPMDLAKLYSRLRGDPPDNRDALYARYLTGDDTVSPVDLEPTGWPGRGMITAEYDFR